MKEQSEKRVISIWGSTGSIGTQTLAVMDAHRDRFAVDVLTAHTHVEQLFNAAVLWKARVAVITGHFRESDWRERFKREGIILLTGREGLLEAASRGEEDLVVNALVGSVGLEATMKALAGGSHIALANKEVLVMAGELVMAEAEKRNLSMLPVDSEHSALFQCLHGENPDRVSRLILTASGGPFRNMSEAEMERVTVEQALNHPNWSMGQKVTIDSATMANKGLEVIEARWLFGVAADRIDVVIHPQSVVHSMVAYCDGSVKAQLSMPDMKLPISYALSFPDRWPGSYGEIDFSLDHTLEFMAPDRATFPCLQLAFDALKAGGTAPAVFNAADEAAVARFLSGDIGFMDIPRLVEQALTGHDVIMNPDLDAILSINTAIREKIFKTSI